MSLNATGSWRRSAVLLTLAAALWWLLASAGAGAAWAADPLLRGDSGEPGPESPSARTQPDREHEEGEDEDEDEDEDDDQPWSVRAERALAGMPATWSDSKLLEAGAIRANDLLARYEAARRAAPWRAADHATESLLAGRELLKRIDPHTQVAYWQAVYLAALSAGRPTDALAAARALIELDNLRGWNWAALYNAGMVAGDKAVCLEAIKGMTPLIDPAGAGVAALKPLEWQAEPIGQTPDFSAPLSDGTTFKSADARGRAVLFDFWAQSLKTYTNAFDQIKALHGEYCRYGAFRMVGVNMDSKQFRNVTDQFIRARGVVWPQYFEGRAGDRPVSMKVFHVKLMPSLAVIDGQGKVIFLGQPHNPLIHAAVRAALRSTNEGKVPDAGATAPPARPTPPPAGAKPQPGQRPVRTPPPDKTAAKAEREKEAAKQLHLAEAYEKADLNAKAVELYRGILAKWPDTEAAVQAQARLLTLERFSP